MENNKKSLTLINILFYAILILIVGVFIYILIPKEKEIPNESILLEKSVILKIGEQHKLKVKDETNISYIIDNSEIANITNNGIISGIAIGKTYVTVKSNNIEEKIVVLVIAHDIESITLNKENLKMKVGETFILTATIKPENTNNIIKWTSSNINVLEVNNGKLIAKSKGNATIYVTSNNGIVASCEVIVEDIPPTPTPIVTSTPQAIIEAKSIKLNYDNVNIVNGDTITLVATITPENTNNKKITWSSSDTKIVTVDKNGKVTAKKIGTATITAKTDNGITATAKIIVKNKTYNKTAIFFGDSITYGINNYSFANYIGDHYDLKKIVNAGIGGGFISLYTQERWILNVVKKHANENYDYIIMQGGVNDTAFPMPLGSYNKTDFSGNYDNSTFIGGLETYIYTVKKQWPKAKLGYIIMYKTPNCEDCIKYSDTYYPKIAEVLNKWNIHYLNLYSGKTSSGQTFSDLLKVNTDTYIKDGTHINEKGHELLAPHIYEWMNKL